MCKEIVEDSVFDYTDVDTVSVKFHRQYERIDNVHYERGQAFEGFDYNGVEPLSRLIHRMLAGQEVDRFEDGCYEDSQVFDDAMVEKFDYLDKVDQLQNESQRRSSRRKNPTESALPTSQEPQENVLGQEPEQPLGNAQGS